MKYKLFSAMFITFILFFSMNSQVAYGDGFNDIEVLAILPENQIDSKVTYFDLLASPGSEQELEVLITNHSEVNREIDLSVNRAYTNQSGTVSYSGKVKEDSPGLIYNIEDIISLEENHVSLLPKESKTVKLRLKIPEKTYSGILVGGLYLLDQTESNSEGNIKNKFAREIGIVLHATSDSKTNVDKISLIDVKANQKDSKNTILLSFENPLPGFFSNFSISGQVTDEKGKETFFDFREDDLSMAPNSVLNFPVYIDGQAFEAGMYEFKGVITQGEKVINVDKKFEITSKEAEKYNQTDISIVRGKWYDNLLIVITVFVLFITVSVAAIMIILNQKNKNSKD